MFVAAIDVEFGPHWADEWLVWVTAASVAVSVWVAIVAVMNGKRATDNAEIASAMARDSEERRFRFEQRAHEESLETAERSVRVSYEQALDDAIVGLIRSVQEHISQKDRWNWFIEDFQKRSGPQLHVYGNLATGKPDTYQAVLTELQVVLLRSRKDDRNVALAAAQAYEALDGIGNNRKNRWLLQTTVVFRQWRNDDVTHENTIASFHKIAAEAFKAD